MNTLGILFALLTSAPAQADGAQPIHLACGQTEPYQVTLTSDPNSHVTVEVTAESAWLELDEQGLDVEISPRAPENEMEMSVPPRYSWRFLKIDSARTFTFHRLQRGDPNGLVLLALHCGKSIELQGRLDWMHDAASISEQVKKQVPITDLASFLAGADALVSSSPDVRTRAFATHLRAQALFLAGRSVDAAAAFAVVEGLWTGIGDRNRARAARLARIEDSVRSGSYSDAVELSRSFPDTPYGKSYFGVRIERSRCLALAYLGRRPEAETCYRWVLAHLEALDERGELANTLQAYAGLEIDAANYAHAEELARHGLDVAEGADVLLYRGRIHLLLGDIALRRGLISEALRACDMALSEFAQAQAPRWEANTMLKVAQLHEQLGDFDEAYSFLSGALARLSARDAPSRWAKGMELFSDLERDHGHLDSAYLWIRAAEHLYAQLEMTGDLDAAVLSRLGIELELGHLGSVAHSLSAGEPHLPVHANEYSLLAADLDVRLGRFDDARLRLDKLQTEPVSLQAQIYLSRLQGELGSSREDVHGALSGLLDEGKSIKKLAERTQSGILRELIGRQARPLRQIAFRLALEHHYAPTGSAWTTNAVWDWLALNASGPRLPGEFAVPGKNVERFENAIAAELFLPASADHAAAESTAQRELLSLLASGGKNAESATPFRPLKLESLQEVLAPDASAFVAFLDGDTRGAVLWVTRQQADFVSSSQPSEVRAHIMELRNLVRSADSPLVEIQAAAKRVSSELFANLQVARPPKHLYVLTDEPFNAVPWSVLTWPGTESFLLDTTTVEYVRLDPGENDGKSSQPINLQIIVAAQQGDHSGLPVLAGAATEAAAIGQAMTSAASSIQTPAATRAAVTSALREPGGWVHIAAHGMAQPQRIGYAGIWLEPSAQEKTPPFLSWIDVLDSGVNADLVVLNACQLGDNGSAVNGNLSFADAVSSAGAKHVVAALWPVSDAAAAIWVPEFYSTIVADPHHDAAQALRAAQLRLRESRAFRHPFFWAGMQVIDRMPIGSKAAH